MKVFESLTLLETCVCNTIQNNKISFGENYGAMKFNVIEKNKTK